MKILSLHCDYIKFKPVKKALKTAKLTKEEENEKQVEEALVILTAVEASDTEAIIEDYIKNIKEIAQEVKAKNIVLYPYAHLSSNLASPDFAEGILKKAEKKLKGFSVTRAPFGFYKQFELKCKGHPLAELSRTLGREEDEKQPSKVSKTGQIGKTILDTRKLNKNDHRIIGQQLDLFSFNEAAPGMVFLHPKGKIIWDELIKYWRKEHKEAGYEEISTPIIMNKQLWKISGHYEHYKENMFFTDYDNIGFAIKPMNCPGAILIYLTKPRSYKELPLKLAELGIVHRQELSGVLTGLFRVVKFTQDDAHIFCTEEQFEQEIINIVKLTDKIYKTFNFAYTVELSTRPEKALGSKEAWDKAEKALGKALKKIKIKYKINKGEGVFYGPKIDFHIKDSLGRTWQTATIQLDFQMPERFKLKYIGKNNKESKPIMLHRTIYGSLDRFLGILTEHYKGNFPLWLSPIQCKVISFTDRNKKTAEKFKEQLEEQGIRAELDIEQTTVENKIRNAELQKIPYIIVIGDKEEKSKTIAVRKHGEKKPKFKIKPKKFIQDIKEEIENRK